MSFPEGDVFSPHQHFYALEKFGNALVRRGFFFRRVGKMDFSIMRIEAREH